MPSIALSAELPDTTSAAAQAGTYRHEWAEYCLKRLEFDATPYVGLTNQDADGEHELLSQDAADEISSALSLVEKIYERSDEMMLEARLDLSRYFQGTNAGDGTADVIIYKPATKHLHVIDFKFGFIEVDVEGNTQAIQYALGALSIYRTRGVDKITIWIAQPRSVGEKHKKWSINVSDLFDEGEALKEDYARTLLSDQPFVVGKHCTFCKANRAGRCTAIRKHSEREAAAGFEAISGPPPGVASTQEIPALPTPDEIGDMLEKAEAIRIYIKALDALADSEARAGRVPSGRKWVSTPGRRAWKADAGGDVAIAKAAQKIIPGLDVWDEKLKTPPALEKEIGKAEFAKLADLVTKSAGGFSLVSVTDKRPAVEYSKSADGFEDASTPETATVW
ncbi:Phage protein [Hyphomicrobium sulfonivorans]|uniref:Phage protein n=1 Tax=Hyphomicrobium sulfonivorans TaxID=121290 RepID=A0A109BPG2_HYPSL|nr:Phage protein [Hyphomicrobium sulfonivorans]